MQFQRLRETVLQGVVGAGTGLRQDRCSFAIRGAAVAIVGVVGVSVLYAPRGRNPGGAVGGREAECASLFRLILRYSPRGTAIYSGIASNVSKRGLSQTTMRSAKRSAALLSMTRSR